LQGEGYPVDERLEVFSADAFAHLGKEGTGYVEAVADSRYYARPSRLGPVLGRCTSSLPREAVRSAGLATMRPLVSGTKTSRRTSPTV
jgi:hypothetical protein